MTQRSDAQNDVLPADPVSEGYKLAYHDPNVIGTLSLVYSAPGGADMQRWRQLDE